MVSKLVQYKLDITRSTPPSPGPKVSPILFHLSQWQVLQTGFWMPRRRHFPAPCCCSVLGVVSSQYSLVGKLVRVVSVGWFVFFPDLVHVQEKFSSWKWLYPETAPMSDFVLILSLLYCWPFSGSALVLACASEKAKIPQCQVNFKGSCTF